MREPLLAGILSFLFIGLGQGYNGQRRKGYLFFASQFVIAVLYFILLKVFKEPFPEKDKYASFSSPSYVIAAICFFIIWIFNIYDAYRFAKIINEGEITIDSTPGKSAFIFFRNIVLGFLSFFVAVILLAILLPLIVKTTK